MTKPLNPQLVDMLQGFQAPTQQPGYVMYGPPPGPQVTQMQNPFQQQGQPQQQGGGNPLGGLLSDPSAIIKGGSKLLAGTGVGNALTTALPYVGMLTGGAGMVKSIKTGNRPGGLMSGAATGASLGSIVPGLGTLLGGALGGLVGWAGAAIKGKVSQAEQTWDGYKQYAGQGGMAQLDASQAGEVFKGMWDTNKATFGKVGGGDKVVFLKDMGQELSSALGAGKLSAQSSPEQIAAYLKPWMASNGANINKNKSPVFWNSLGDMGQRILMGQDMAANSQGAGNINIGMMQPAVQQPNVPQAPKIPMADLGSALVTPYTRGLASRQGLMNIQQPNPAAAG